MWKDLRALVKFNINHSINQPKYVIIIDIALYIKNIDKCPVFASIFLATDMNTIYIFDDKNERILDKDQFLLRSKHFLLLRQINMLLCRPILLKRSDQGIKWIRIQTHSYPNRLIVPKTLWSSKHSITVILQFTSLKSTNSYPR